jgi:hypothetical protein
MRTRKGLRVAAEVLDFRAGSFEMLARPVDAALASYVANVEVGRARLGVRQERIKGDDMATFDRLELGGIRHLDMVYAPVHAVDGPIGHLVAGKAFSQDTACNGFSDGLAVSDVLVRRALVSDAVIRKRPMHGFDEAKRVRSAHQ